MHCLRATHRAARVAAVAVALALGSVVAYAQQPSAAAMTTAKELVTVMGGATYFEPLIPGVIEQSKILFLQQNPGLAKDLNEIAIDLRERCAHRLNGEGHTGND